eukprot:s65_g19.t1
MMGSDPTIGEEGEEEAFEGEEEEPEEPQGTREMLPHMAALLQFFVCLSGARGATDKTIAPISGTTSTEAHLSQSYLKEYH